jgi:hypothetical protein
MAIFSALWAFLTIGQSPSIVPVKRLNISCWSLVKSLIVGFLIGFISLIITLVTFTVFNWQPPDIVFFILVGPVIVSISERSGSQLKITIKPNQGIGNSFANVICLASLGSVWLGLSAYFVKEKLFFLIVSWLFNKPATSASSVLSLSDTVVIVIAGILVGTLFGLLNESGIVCIQHFILRLILCHKGYIPWNYARFLNYCTERLFLQRVGGRYRFIHRLLQEHFAAMPLEK